MNRGGNIIAFLALIVGLFALIVAIFSVPAIGCPFGLTDCPTPPTQFTPQPAPVSTSARPTATVPPTLLNTSVEVSANKGWQSAGIEVNENVQIHLEVADGRWTPWPWDTMYDGEGDSSYICVKAYPANRCSEPLINDPEGELVGQIGDQVFKVGNTATFVAKTHGLLYLRINDTDYGLGDNQGSLIVNISAWY